MQQQITGGEANAKALTGGVEPQALMNGTAEEAAVKQVGEEVVSGCTQLTDQMKNLIQQGKPLSDQMRKKFNKATFNFKSCDWGNGSSTLRATEQFEYNGQVYTQGAPIPKEVLTKLIFGK